MNKSTPTPRRFNRGDLVQTWFDTGASFGYAILYGVVIESGPKAARVRWESSLTNRVRQDSTNVKPAADQADARAAMNRASPPTSTQ